MRTDARRAMRLLVRSVPAVVGTGAALLLVAGSFSDLAELRILHGLVLLALAGMVLLLTWSRTRHVARDMPPKLGRDVELGSLVLVLGYCLVQPLGGIDSPAYPLVYLILAFLVAFLPARAGAILAGIAIALDLAIFAGAGQLADRWPTFLFHALFLAVFAALYRLVFAANVLAGRFSGKLAVRQRQRELEERARQYRLGLAAGADEPVDAETWVRAAVREVEEAVGNALEVAECALRSHTVAVFLLSGDDRSLVLHDCRSQADDVLRDPFDAKEGIVGAVLARRMSMRLCGEVKGVSWYAGRKPIRSVLAVPLVDRRGSRGGAEDGFVRGLLVADRLEPIPFSDDDERLLLATSREVLRAIEAERVMGWIRKARDEKEQLFAAIEELNRCTRLQEVIETTLRLVQALAPLDLVAFVTSEEENGRLVHKVEQVAGDERFRPLGGISFPDDRGLVSNAIRYGTVLPGRDLGPFESPQIFDESTRVRGLQTLKIVPIPGPLGAIVCGARRKRALDSDAVRSLQVLASQAGQALLRARLYAQTERMATTDGLTGLINHRTFQARFDEELARAARTGRKVAVLITDIDHFKSINDTYGHATGDLVLKEVARIIQRCARSTDFVARYGGEEFAIVLPETDMRGGKIIAERIRKAVEEHVFQTELGPLRCTLSVGVASYPDVSLSKQELFEKADQCLYHCKRTGRNRSCTVEEMRRVERADAAEAAAALSA